MDKCIFWGRAKGCNIECNCEGIERGSRWEFEFNGHSMLCPLLYTLDFINNGKHVFLKQH